MDDDSADPNPTVSPPVWEPWSVGFWLYIKDREGEIKHSLYSAAIENKSQLRVFKKDKMRQDWNDAFLLLFAATFYTCQYTAILGLNFLIENRVIDILIVCRSYVFFVNNYVEWFSELFQKE